MNRNTSSYLSSSVRHLLRLSFENCRDTSLNNQALQCLRKEGQVLVFEDQPIQSISKCIHITATVIIVIATQSEFFQYFLK